MVNIATIQATHIPRNINYRSDGYRIKTSASAKDTQRQWIATGGVSVIIHTELEQPITQIMGESRAMYIALGSWKSHAPITILATYAPRSARKKEEQKEHWEQINDILVKISTGHIIICCADANGHIGEITNSEMEPQRIIWQNANAKISQKGIGGFCEKFLWWDNATDAKMEAHAAHRNWKYNLRRPNDAEGYLQLLQINRNPWISPNWQAQRQIDYVRINRRCRYIVKRSWAAQGWRGGLGKQRQRAVIRTGATVRCANNFFGGNTRNRRNP